MMVNEELHNLTVKYKELTQHSDWLLKLLEIPLHSREKFHSEEAYLTYKEDYDRLLSLWHIQLDHIRRERHAIEEAILKHSNTQ